ncbi:MAG: response regulator [Bacteroidetes bacterium]|nr:response regulator [Bacteroidota bacterium]
MFTVIIAEDEPKLLRHIINKLEETAPDFKVIASATNGTDALKLIREHNPDVVFTDIVMPGMDGLELIKELRSESFILPIVILSGYDDFNYAQHAIKYSVKDYLLKPLEEEELQKTLDKLRAMIREGIMQNGMDVFRYEIESESLWNAPVKQVLADGDYLLLEICLGNLYQERKYLSDDLAKQYKDSWHRLMPQNHFSKNDFAYVWLIDEPYLNRKFMVLKSLPGHPVRMQEAVEEMKNIWEKAISPLTVNVIYTPYPIPYRDIPIRCRAVKSLLRESVSLFDSRVIACTEINSPKNNFLSTTPDYEKKIYILAQSGEYKSLRKEIVSRLIELNEAKSPQDTISTFFTDLVRMLRKSAPFISKEQLDLFTVDMKRAICSSLSSRGLLNQVDTLLKNLIPQKENLTPERIADLLELYLSKHYMESINLEIVSDHLGFNVSYLTQIFKKYKQETPGRFLIKKRIEKAKELLSQRPDVNIEEIGRMIGYEDSHYFYRIFKKYTGKTPAFFRE